MGCYIRIFDCIIEYDSDSADAGFPVLSNPGRRAILSELTVYEVSEGLDFEQSESWLNENNTADTFFLEIMREDLKMNSIKVFSAIVLVLAVDMVGADTPRHQSYTGSPEFEKIKQLAGTWRGKSILQGKEQDITITYQVTSAGSAVVARHFPGTPNEMVSVFHDNGGKLSMTHYCALKNQPILGLKSATANSIELEYTDGINIDQDKDAHMRSLTITFVDDQRIVEQWSMNKEGKNIERSPIKLIRVQE